MIFKFLRLIYQFSKVTLGMALVRVVILILRCVLPCTYYSNKKLNYYSVCFNGVISSVGIWCIYIPSK